MAIRSVRPQLIAVVAAVALAFGGGWWLGHGDGKLHVPVMYGDGYVGIHVVSLFVGDTAYGAKGSIRWTDSAGTLHADETWPACLPDTTEVKHVRFAGATLYFGDDGVGEAMIIWVDCRG